MVQNTKKAMSLRLPAEQAAAIDAVARADGMSVTDAIRVAIDAHIDARRSDDEFQGRLKQYIRDHQDVLERLAR